MFNFILKCLDICKKAGEAAAIEDCRREREYDFKDVEIDIANE